MRITSNSIIKFLFVLLTTLLVVACGNSGEKLTAIPAGSTVLILGDSLSYGTGASGGEDYPTLLAKIHIGML